MAKYKSYDDFVLSNDNLLECKPLNFYIDGGQINFIIECDGIDFYGVGTHELMSDMLFQLGLSFKEQCKFKHLYMINKQTEEVVCDW